MKIVNMPSDIFLVFFHENIFNERETVCACEPDSLVFLVIPLRWYYNFIKTEVCTLSGTGGKI